MNSMNKRQRRWMASALKTAAGDVPALPFQRGFRKPMVQRCTVVRFQQPALRSA